MAGTVDRDAVVAALADEIRDAVEAGERWAPDYDALMTRTGRRRSWCEKAVKDARTAVLEEARTDGSPAGSTRTDGTRTGASRTDGARTDSDARTEDAGSRTEDGAGSRTDEAEPGAEGDDRLVLAGANGHVT
jgi:hypothetical protein